MVPPITPAVHDTERVGHNDSRGDASSQQQTAATAATVTVTAVGGEADSATGRSERLRAAMSAGAAAASPRALVLPQVACQVRTRLPTSVGECHVYLYRNTADDKEHLAFVFGGTNTAWSRSLERARPDETAMDRIIRGAAPTQQPLQASTAPNNSRDKEDAPVVRIHSECFTGETLHSVRCDCGEQLLSAMRTMNRLGRGIIIYLRQEGRGIGLLEKLKAYNLQDIGHDTVAANLLLSHPADARTYGAAIGMLRDLGCDALKLLTNNPDKIEQLQQGGWLHVADRLPMIPERWQEQHATDGSQRRVDGEGSGSYVPNEMDGYLFTKVERMRHLLDLPANVMDALKQSDPAAAVAAAGAGNGAGGNTAALAATLLATK